MRSSGAVEASADLPRNRCVTNDVAPWCGSSSPPGPHHCQFLPFSLIGEPAPCRPRFPAGSIQATRLAMTATPTVGCRKRTRAIAIARPAGVAVDIRIQKGAKGFGQAALMRHIVVDRSSRRHGSRGASRSWAKNASSARSETNCADLPEARCSTRPVNRRPRPPVAMKCTTNARSGGNVGGSQRGPSIPMRDGSNVAARPSPGETQGFLRGY